jgi:cytoskeletal protein CcmA (bactofilin family)
MADIGLETLGAPAVNGDRDAHAVDVVPTVLAKDDALSGRLDIRSSGSVLGTFSGHIECEGDLLIGPEAHVEADIRGARVTIAGYVRGNVVAQTRLKITNTGRLEGDARVGTLVVQEGGVHHGVIRVHPEGIPENPEPSNGASTAKAAQAGSRQPSDPVGRVKKFWGEFF